MQTRGTIVDHGVAMPVVGLSWMDHQWGAFDFASGGGWDWFSIRLTDRRQYMLYFLRDSSGQIVQTVGTLVRKHGCVTHLAPSTYAERALGTWHLKDQELDLRAIQGAASGRATSLLADGSTDMR